MAPDNQSRIKDFAEAAKEDGSQNDMIVVLGASDTEGALISAETVTTGDPSFSGPLAGVSLKLPVYHILEPEVQKAVPSQVYEENVGILTMTNDQEKIGQEFVSIRKKVTEAD